MVLYGSVYKEATMPTISSDYADRFDVATDVRATPEQWARAMFGDVPDLGGRLIWQVLLGLRLSPGRSPETVAGWPVTGRGPDWIRLATASWFLGANLVVRAGEGRVALATFVRFDRPPARAVWTPGSALHRVLVPGVLRAAAAKLRASR